MPQRPSIGKPGKPLRAMIFWVILVLVLLIAFQMFEMGKTPEYRISYSEFLRQIDAGNLKTITVKGLEVHGVLLTSLLSRWVRRTTTKPLNARSRLITSRSFSPSRTTSSPKRSSRRTKTQSSRAKPPGAACGSRF